MAWIESHDTLKDHPKTRRLRRFLGITLPQTIGHLHMFWWWALEYAEDGDLSGYDSFDIAEAAGWDGDEEQFVTALVDSGFIDKHDDDRLCLHDWHCYAGRLIEKREQNRERQQRYRERQQNEPPNNEQEDDSVSTASVTRYARVTNAPTLTVPIPKDIKDNMSDSSSDDENTSPAYSEIVGYLNEKTGKKFRAATDATKRHVRARWREGYRLHDFRAVIDKKCTEWLGTDMERYLRPETLFGPKFESYANEPLPSIRPRSPTEPNSASRLADVFRQKADELEKGGERDVATA